jgi:DNA helicase-2/ATP-dependent DNA helicase PcrA
MNSSESYAKTKNFDDDFTQDFPDYEESSSSGYKKGMRIRHPTFGLGSIFEVEGAGDNMKLSVLFTDQTIKKFVAKYARLEKL